MHPRWLLGSVLPRRAHPSLARLADDLFGAIVFAAVGPLVPQRQPVHHRLWLWLLMILAIAVSQGIEQRGGRHWRRPGRRPRWSLPSPTSASTSASATRATAAVRKREPRSRRRSSPRRRRWISGSATWCGASEPDRPRAMADVRRPSRKRAAGRRQYARSHRPRRARSATAAAAQIPLLVDPPDRPGRALWRCSRARDHRRRALRPACANMARLYRDSASTSALADRLANGGASAE